MSIVALLSFLAFFFVVPFFPLNERDLPRLILAIVGLGVTPAFQAINLYFDCAVRQVQMKA